MIASCTGVDLPVGLALMGAGTLCTAYSSGLFDFDDDGNYVGLSNENLAYFGFSMCLNAIVGGVSAVGARTTFKATGSEVMQIASRNAVVDQRGIYVTDISRKYVVSRGSINTAEKYLVETELGTTIGNQIKKILVNSFGKDILINFIWQNQKKFSEKLNCY